MGLWTRLERRMIGLGEEDKTKMDTWLWNNWRRLGRPFVVFCLVAIIAIVAVLIFRPRPACAATLRMSGSEAWGLTWDMEGNHAEPPPQTLVALGVGESIGSGWVVFGDLMAVVPRSAFHPSYRIIPGVVKRWGGEKPEAGDFCLGFSLMFQWNLGYGAAEHSYALGVTGGPGVFVTKEMAISFAIGDRLGLDNAWSPKAHVLALGPTLTFLLPL